jgi:hypothetical protein
MTKVFGTNNYGNYSPSIENIWIRKWRILGRYMDDDKLVLFSHPKKKRVDIHVGRECRY